MWSVCRVGGVLLLGWWTWQTAHYVPVWRSEAALWAYAVQRAPEKPRPLINHAVMRAAAGEVDAAERFLLRAWRAAQAAHLPAYERVVAEQGIRENLAALLHVRAWVDRRSSRRGGRAGDLPNDLGGRMGL